MTQCDGFLSVASWAVVINFKHPSVGPVDEEEEKVFAELEQLLSSGMMSSIIGWAICQGTAVALQRGEKRLWQLWRACVGSIREGP